MCSLRRTFTLFVFVIYVSVCVSRPLGTQCLHLTSSDTLLEDLGKQIYWGHGGGLRRDNDVAETNSCARIWAGRFTASQHINMSRIDKHFLCVIVAGSANPPVVRWRVYI